MFPACFAAEADKQCYVPGSLLGQAFGLRKKISADTYTIILKPCKAVRVALVPGAMLAGPLGRQSLARLR